MQKQPVQRWPLGAPGDATPRSRDVWVLTIVVGLGLAALLLHLKTWERVACLVASLGGLWRFALVMRWRRTQPPRGEVAIDTKGVVRHEKRVPSGERRRAVWMTTRLCEFDAPLGVTVLANHLRTTAVVAFTTPEQTRFLTLRVAGPEDALAAADLLARATTIPDADAAGNGDATAMTAAHAAELVRAVEKRASGALARMYLSGSRNEAIVLDADAGKLEIGEKKFDLRSPLEWRGFMFHEAVGQVATLYQATWVRQGTTEAVLVAPMPPEVTTLLAGGPRDLKEPAQRALVRDLKLMQSLPDSPPVRELRVAIERLFMLPLRQVLDRAPKAPRAAVPPAHTLNPSA